MRQQSKLLKKVRPIFAAEKNVKLAYLFGSRVSGDIGPLSDYDFAVYFEQTDKKKIFNAKLHLLNKLTNLLKTDKVDLVVLNNLDKPELKFNIIKTGELIFESEPYKVLIEPKIMNEYFDFRQMLLKYNLTQK